MFNEFVGKNSNGIFEAGLYINIIEVLQTEDFKGGKHSLIIFTSRIAHY